MITVAKARQYFANKKFVFLNSLDVELMMAYMLNDYQLVYQDIETSEFIILQPTRKLRPNTQEVWEFTGLYHTLKPCNNKDIINYYEHEQQYIELLKGGRPCIEEGFKVHVHKININKSEKYINNLLYHDPRKLRIQE